MSKKPGKYAQIIQTIFFKTYEEGITSIPFGREEMNDAADRWAWFPQHVHCPGRQLRGGEGRARRWQQHTPRSPSHQRVGFRWTCQRLTAVPERG